MNNKYIRYVILIDKLKEYPKELIKEHVEYLKQFEQSGKLVMCGPFQDAKGGIIILKVDSSKEAKSIGEADPFTKGGYNSCKIRILNLSCKENNHLGFG